LRNLYAQKVLAGDRPESPMRRKESFSPYKLPAGGWGSANSLGNILSREGVLLSGPLHAGVFCAT
jgi:hypothetical protein